MNLIHREPALFTGFIVALLTLLVSFGVPINPEQRDAIVGIVTPALALAGAIWVRSKVSPVDPPPHG